jgi:hypothetical protein
VIYRAEKSRLFFSRAPPRLYYRRGASLDKKSFFSSDGKKKRDARVHHAAGDMYFGLYLVFDA